MERKRKGKEEEISEQPYFSILALTLALAFKLIHDCRFLDTSFNAVDG